MSAGVTTLFGASGVGAAFGRAIDALRVKVRRDVHARNDRVVRIEGALAGPYRLPPAAPEANE